MKYMKIVLYILIAIILIAAITLAIYFFIQNGQKDKLIKQSEAVIADADTYSKTLQDAIKELKDKPPIVIEKYITLTDVQKEQAYIDLVTKYNKAISIIDDNKKMIDTLNSQLKKVTDALKKNHRNEISGFVLGSIDKTLTPDLYLGVIYQRKLLITPLVDFAIGGGVAVKTYKEQGGGLLFSMSVSF